MTRHLQPFAAAERLKSAYRSYITTSFPLRREELRRRFDALVDGERLLWQDAFVSLARPPRPGRSFAELAEAGVTVPDLTERVAFGFPRLHDHQSRAIERLSTLGEARSTVVATGTGSGKTEAFLVPIIDHCLRHPGDGVRAIVLYPMNALANDQLKRLRRVLGRTPEVSFGRFTGDAPEDEASAERRGQPGCPPESPPNERYYRQEMRDRPPNVLLTNHTMLELLLTRRRERQALFEQAPLRYLVIDEVHTFQGVLGAEVACLLRRLKEHVGCRRGELICVGTSATLHSGGSTSDLVRFTADLFGEPFDEDSVVEEHPAPLPEVGAVPAPHGEVDPALLEGDPTEPATLRRLSQALLGEPLDEVGDPELPVALYELCRTHPLFVEVERALASPLPVRSLAGELRRLPGRQGMSDEALCAEATAALLIGAAAHAPVAEGEEEPEPRFRPKVHLIMRSLSPLHRCLDPGCGALLTDGRRECTEGGHASPALALPLGVCRTCGQDYWMGFAEVAGRTPRQRLQHLPGLTLQAALAREGDGLAVLLMAADRAAELGSEEDEEDEATEPGVPYEAQRVPVRRLVICSGCRTLRADAAAPCAGPGCSRTAPSHEVDAFTRGSQCPVCLSSGKGHRPEIITPLRSGASSSIAVLTTALFDELDEEERRTLIFADSRQDTAHQAGFLRERHQVFVRRQLLFQALRGAADPVPLSALANHVLDYAISTYGESEAFNLLIPGDLRDMVEKGFYRRGALPSGVDIKATRDRLRWHVLLELTALAQQRNAMEREGLLGVRYSRLDDLVRLALGDFTRWGITAPEHLAELLTGVLDVMRYAKAVAYLPFTLYLSSRAQPVDSGEAAPTHYTRMPVAFAARSRSTAVYRVTGWYGEKGRRTALDDLVLRLGLTDDSTARHDLIDALVECLKQSDFIRQVKIGDPRKYGGQVTEGSQIDPDRIEVFAVDGAWRCDRCGRSRRQSLRDATGEQVCTTYECRGRLQRRRVDPDASYYADLYERHEPRPMHAMEHSSQLPGEMRAQIERQFNEAGINVLVCTPTLELGVDLPDLVALLMRNIPPTPTNYAQRAGRAGRQRRIALVISHAGQGPHDAYFFARPEEMITGSIRPPVLMLDNRVIVRRHIHSLILQRLSVDVPGRWEDLVDENGHLVSDLGGHMRAELESGPVRERVATSVARAFVDDNLPWVDRSFVDEVVDGFPGAVDSGLRQWSDEYVGLVDEHHKIKVRKQFNTREEKRQLDQLERRMQVMREDMEYRPLAFLARVGVLPRYGFPGQTVRVTDEGQRSISQVAAVGITEYAPGNRVYVAGRKLTVGRIYFAGGAKENVREHTQTYRFCERCSYMSRSMLATTCRYCGDDSSGSGTLVTREYIDYVHGQGVLPEFISDEDEYRNRSEYATATYLEPLSDSLDASRHRVEDVTIGPWMLRHSRLRSVHIFNRGLHQYAGRGRDGFMICLRCGAYHSPAQQDRDERSAFSTSTGHAVSCTVPGWPAASDEPKGLAVAEVERRLHLHVAVEGDVLEIPMPGPVASGYAAGDRSWVTTLAYALRLGLQLEMFIGEREIEHVIAIRRSASGPEVDVVFYDTLPGGTGYLRRLHRSAGDVAARAHEHLTSCACERACYRCLLQFWNQRDHDVLDKRLVLPMLGLLAQAATSRPVPALSQSEHFDSIVEAVLWRRLEEAGAPRTAVGATNVLRDQSGRGILQMDLSWPDQRLLVLLDGREFHARTVEQILADQEKRNAAVAAGQRVLEFTAWEVVHRLDQVVEEILATLEGAPYSGRAGNSERLVAEMPDGPVFVRTGELASGLGPLSASGFTGEGSVTVGRLRVPALAIREQQPSAALLEVDTRRWIDEPARWRSDLAAMRTLTRAGVRCYRAPRERLDTEQAQTFVEGLVAHDL